MGDYDDYVDRFLAALYYETESTGSEFNSAQKIHSKFGFAPDKPHWISRMADEWEYRYFKNVNKTIGGYDGWNFRISPEGSRKVEAEFRDLDEVRSFLLPVSDTDSNDPGLTISDYVQGEVVPASNRLVRLDHNRPEYEEIAKGLEDLQETVRANNEVGEHSDERDRLLRSLSAARELWSAAELRIIQVRIGVIMAVEDATNALAKVSQAVAGALLVDLLKKFFKDQTGVEF